MDTVTTESRSPTGPLVLIGYSGHAAVVLDCLRAGGRTVIGYLDRRAPLADDGPLPYLGNEDTPEGRNVLIHHPYLVAIGSNIIRERLVAAFDAYTVAAAAIHPSACLSPTATVLAGSLVAPLAVVNAAAVVGQHCIVNTRAVVEHDCRLDDLVHLAPGATLLGNVTVGRGTLIGANAVVLPGLRIGARCVVGAGAVVVRNVPDNTTVAGNPARILKHSQV